MENATTDTPAYRDKNVRAGFGKWAGGFYAVANIGMLFKGVIDDALAGNEIDIMSVTDDPVSASIGTLFLTASGLLAYKGDNNKWAGASLAITTVGYGILTGMTVADGHEISSTIGSAAGTLACAYSTVQSYLIKPTEEKKTEVAEGKKSLFGINWKSINEQYPYWSLGVVDVAANVVVAKGAVGIDDWTLAGVAALWTFGSTLLALALPNVTKKDALQPQ
jgi:hypothetical protein